MPTFQQAIDADPSKFLSMGASLAKAAATLTSTAGQYAQEVASLGSVWRGQD